MERQVSWFADVVDALEVFCEANDLSRTAAHLDELSRQYKTEMMAKRLLKAAGAFQK